MRTAETLQDEATATRVVGGLIDRRVKPSCCGVTLAECGTGGNWGDWKCMRCGTAFCQDCGAQINMWTMQCSAYEDSQDAARDA